MFAAHLETLYDTQLKNLNLASNHTIYNIYINNNFYLFYTFLKICFLLINRIPDSKRRWRLVVNGRIFNEPTRVKILDRVLETLNFSSSFCNICLQYRIMCIRREFLMTNRFRVLVTWNVFVRQSLRLLGIIFNGNYGVPKMHQLLMSRILSCNTDRVLREN